MSTLIQKKICLLGDFSVGKTSLVERYVYNRFSERYLSTIGVKISRKSIAVARGVNLNMLIWDLAGSEKFSGVQSVYLQGTLGAIFVCDLTRPETLSSLAKYYEQLEAISPGIPIILAGNKTDLKNKQKLTQADLEQEAQKFNTASVIMTSAKTGKDVEMAFEKLAQHLI